MRYLVFMIPLILLSCREDSEFCPGSSAQGPVSVRFTEEVDIPYETELSGEKRTVKASCRQADVNCGSRNTLVQFDGQIDLKKISLRTDSGNVFVNDSPETLKETSGRCGENVLRYYLLDTGEM